MKKVLITGITGQDGSYLAEYLLSKNYEVHGIVRRISTFNTERIDDIPRNDHDPKNKFFLHYGDLSDSEQISNLIYNIKPDEIYNLAAQSHVKISFDLSEYTGDITALGVTRILEAVRKSNIKTKFYQASSSEMFGSAPPPQKETTPFMPRSPYAIAKLYAYWMTVNYREGYNIFASNGILFNHESPRRGENFVTRKITLGLANIMAGNKDVIYLGNLDSKRDWGFAAEYVQAMHTILQQSKPDDFVIGTGETHSIKEFIEEAFKYAGLKWKKYIKIDKRYFRPTEVNYLLADITKAKNILKWQPKIKFNELVKIMVDYDLEKVGLKPIGEGNKILKEKKFDWILNKKKI